MDVGPGDCVLEVGTGTGILTDALADRAGALVSCEVDRRLQEVTRGLREWPASVTFLLADVLAGKHRLNPAVIEPWQEAAGGRRLRVVSNLPYAVATPFLANLLWDGIEVQDAVVCVQKEAAERFTAATGSAHYGPMAVAVGLLAEARILRRFGPQVFWPVPKVDSALLRLAPREPGRARALKGAGLPQILQKAFLHRRKTLRKRFDPDALQEAGIDPDARPQEVPPEGWSRLLTVPPV